MKDERGQTYISVEVLGDRLLVEDVPEGEPRPRPLLDADSQTLVTETSHDLDLTAQRRHVAPQRRHESNRGAAWNRPVSGLGPDPWEMGKIQPGNAHHPGDPPWAACHG